MSAIIHFGMPKTGSTSIRQTVFSFSQATGEGAFSYLGYMGQGMSASPLIRILYRSDDKIALDQLEGSGIDRSALAIEKEKAIRFLKDKLSATKEKTLVLSSEAIPVITQADLEDFLGYFAAANIPVRGIGYIRPPKGFMESSFQQAVKTRQVKFRPDFSFPRYKNMFDKFIPVFGRDNVEFIPFDKKIFPNECVVQDFIRRAGLDIPVEQIKFANDGLSREATSLLYTYRKFATPAKNNALSYHAGRFKVLGLVGNAGKTKLRFHSRIVQPVLDQNNDHIRWMEETLGASLTESLEADDNLAISSEADLMTFSAETLEWLAGQITDANQAKKVLTGDPKEVAKGMDLLIAPHIPV